MKLRKRKLFSSMAFVLSLVMLAVSGAVFVHTATQQSVSSSITVTFDGRNVDFTASAVYQVKNSDTQSVLTSDGNAASANNTSISYRASDNSSTVKTLQTVTNPEMTASDTYVLFTYTFTNTASDGAYDINVSLVDSSTRTGTIYVKYLASDANYFSTNGDKSDAMDTFISSITSTSPVSVTIPAGGTKYYYILISLDDTGTLSGSYTSTIGSGLVWTVECSNTVTMPATPISNFTISSNQITAVDSGLSGAVVIPNSVTGIMNEAFKNRTDITSVYIPSSVKGIGWNAFSGCSNLTSIEFEDTNNWYATNYSVNELKTLTNTSTNATMLTTAYDSGGRADCYWTKTATKPIDIAAEQTTTALGVDTSSHKMSRFSYRGEQTTTSALQISYVVVPYGIVSTWTGSIDDFRQAYAFSYSEYIETVVFPNSLAEITDSVFMDSPNITNIIIPDTIVRICSSAFSGCDNITYYTYNNAKYLGNSDNHYVALITATGTSITSFNINENCKCIASSAFYECSSMTSITIPSSVTSITNHAFHPCTNLSSVTFENTSGWQMSTSYDFTNPSSIDVTNPNTNATNLKNYGAWSIKCLRRVDA